MEVTFGVNVLTMFLEPLSNHEQSSFTVMIVRALPNNHEYKLVTKTSTEILHCSTCLKEKITKRCLTNKHLSDTFAKHFEKPAKPKAENKTLEF